MRRSFVLAAWLAASPLAAQVPAVGGLGTTVRGGVIYEGYFLGSGLAFDRITLLTVPFSVAQRFGDRLSVDIGAAYASASVRTIGGTIDHSGATDTDIRAAFALVPGRLILTVVGTLPTGTETVSDTTLPLFGATATDLFGFATQSFGSGGAITAGFASAFRLGESWAFGTGGSYRYSGSYVPVAGGGELSPGGEARVRFGLEGPFARGRYFRGALVYTRSEHDDIGGGPPSIIGDRILGYVALSIPVGRGSLSLYGWDMRRLRPRARTTTYANAIQVPQGNVVAVGARLDRPLSPALTLSPLLEFRHELSGTDRLEFLGYLARPGVDLRYRLGGGAALVVRGQVAFGRLRDEGTSVSLVGPRVGAVLEWIR